MFRWPGKHIGLYSLILFSHAAHAQPASTGLGNTVGSFTTTAAGNTESLALDETGLVRLLNKITSGVNRDVLNSFFQLSLNDLLSDRKEISFASSIFAIRLKTNPDLNISENYFREKFSRNTNIYYALRLDNSFRFNGLKFGVKYALLNKRDYTVARDFIPRVNEAMASYNRRFADLTQRAITLSEGNRDARSLYLRQIDSLFNIPGYSGEHMDSALKAALQESDLQRQAGLRDKINEAYYNILDDYAGKPLIVAGSDFTTYTDRFRFSDINGYIDGIGGIAKSADKRFSLECSARVNLGLGDDSSRAVRDLDRIILSGEAGLNAVFRNKVMLPTVELKLAVADSVRMSGRYGGEALNVCTLNGTVRIWITREISIPLTVRYDAEHRDLLGVLNITGNMDMLRNAFGRQ